MVTATSVGIKSLFGHATAQAVGARAPASELDVSAGLVAEAHAVVTGTHAAPRGSLNETRRAATITT